MALVGAKVSVQFTRQATLRAARARIKSQSGAASDFQRRLPEVVAPVDLRRADSENANRLVQGQIQAQVADHASAAVSCTKGEHRAAFHSRCDSAGAMGLRTAT